MNRYLLFFTCIIFLLAACKKEESTGYNSDGKPITGSDSWYPMQVGNYWRISDNDYTEIQDTLRINNKLYYKFYSLIGGDGQSVNYLRIDENQNLIEAYTRYPNQEDTRAKFAGQLGEVFSPSSSNQNTGNNFFVKISYKSESKMIFLLDIDHNNFLYGGIPTTYYKGIGPDYDGLYTTIKIGGKVYNYQKK